MNNSASCVRAERPKNAVILRFAQQVARQRQPAVARRLHASLNDVEFADLLNEIGLHLLSTHFEMSDS